MKHASNSYNISRQIELTGKAARWQEIPGNLIRFGSLAEQMYELEQWGWVSRFTWWNE